MDQGQNEVPAMYLVFYCYLFTNPTTAWGAKNITIVADWDGCSLSCNGRGWDGNPLCV